jgi:hypothetical protein
MYAKDVIVYFNGKYITVTVPCVPSTPIEILKDRAIKILERKEEKRRKEESEYVLWQLENGLINFK